MKTVRVVLRPTTQKPSTLVLRLNQETRAPSLRVPGADHTRRYPTSGPPDHRVPNLCDHPRSSALGLLLLPWSLSLYAMPHLPPAHHEANKRDSPNEIKVKEKQNKTIPDSNSNLAKSMTHHNQTKELTTWFLMESPQQPHLRQRCLRQKQSCPLRWPHRRERTRAKSVIRE
jgi:hypothetical protein